MMAGSLMGKPLPPHDKNPPIGDVRTHPIGKDVLIIAR
jgi:hypothetical protein